MSKFSFTVSLSQASHQPLAYQARLKLHIRHPSTKSHVFAPTRLCPFFETSLAAQECFSAAKLMANFRGPVRHTDLLLNRVLSVVMRLPSGTTFSLKITTLVDPLAPLRVLSFDLLVPYRDIDVKMRSQGLSLIHTHL